MNQKILITALVVVVGLSTLAILEVSNGFISGLVFDQIPYNYTAKVWIPPTHPDDPSSGSLVDFTKSMEREKISNSI
nr:hypothetical protein [Methanobacterium formicicum]